MQDYWDWKKAKALTDGTRNLLDTAQTIVERQMWYQEHLKVMNDTSSELYKHAILLGLPHGLVTGFNKDFKSFKRVYRVDYRSARSLAAINQGGGFTA